MAKRFASLLLALCTGLGIALAPLATLAGTTGTLGGDVVDATTGAPIAAAVITVTSPSQSASTTTDGRGHFTFVSLAPDTYTVAAQLKGYDPTSLAGVSVFADQAFSISLQLHKTLREIAKVSARSASALVKPGTTADIYSVNASVAKTAATLGGGGGLNNAYSAIASVPGVFVPAGQKGEYQSIFVRGGNYTQVGYEFDGVPIQRAFDQYPGASLSNLGQQELQVYTGTAPVNTDSTALAGFINQVIKTGTYPGFGDATVGLGSPEFYHSLKIETGGATPDRLFSYYAGLSGYNQDFAYEKNFELSSIYGAPINLLATNCASANPTGGCYINNIGAVPNGFEHGPIFYGSGTNLASRDFVANFHFALPHHFDGGRDDIQLLYTNDYVRTSFADAVGDMPAALRTDFLNGTITQNGTVIPNCGSVAPGTTCSNNQTPGTGYVPRFFDKVNYLGATGVQLGATDVANTAAAPFPDSPAHGFNGALPLNERDSYQQNGSIFKLQYQKNIGTSAYLRLYGYSSYSDWLQYAPNTQALLGTNFGGVTPDYKLGAHTRGLSMTFADQINSEHLLNVNASFTTASTFRWNDQAVTQSNTANAANTRSVAWLVDSTNPTNGICYQAAAAPGAAVAIDCGSKNSSRYVLPSTPGSLVTAHGTDPTVGTAGTYTCGGHPCEYFTAANGQNGVYNTVVPKFFAFSAQDSWHPSDKLLFTLGLRYDDFRYQLADTTGNAARQFWVNYYNTWYCYSPGAQSVASLASLGGKTPNGCAAVPGGGWQQLAFSSYSAPVNDYPEWQPRLGMTYTQNTNNVWRVSYGKTAQPASSAFQQYNLAGPNIVAGTNLLFYPLGFTTPRHIVNPEESYNFDVSWEHALNGTDVSWKLTPYIRTTKNELSTVILDPVTSFVSSVNVGKKNVKGLEFQIQKGSPTRNGLFAQFNYTYTYAREQFTPLPNGKTVVDGLNLGVIGYNRMTSFCTSNPNDVRCALPANTPASALGAPCYTTAGAPAPTCPAGSVANPYWNAPAQSLFDPNGSYAVYNTLSGSRFVSGSNQSYVVPHVASLILNYKHDKLNVTPTFQFMGGGQYGRPTQVFGANPASCGGVLATPVANDPRYPNGAAGGSPYNAATCASSLLIPDPYTGHFDNYGAFREPNVFYGNLSFSYDLSPKITAHLDLVNLIAKCWGGSNVPWRISGNAGCNYGVGGFYSSNFYNPGDQIDQIAKYPYNPNFGSTFQSTSGGQANPFQFFFSMNVKL